MEALDSAEKKNENHHGTMIEEFGQNSMVERD
jgi:hypothetical protein